jgi:hypothetical protein
MVVTLGVVLQFEQLISKPGSIPFLWFLNYDEPYQHRSEFGIRNTVVKYNFSGSERDEYSTLYGMYQVPSTKYTVHRTPSTVHCPVLYRYVVVTINVQ